MLTCGFAFLCVGVMTVDISSAQCARFGNPAYLAQALQSCRNKTLALLDAYAQALGNDLTVPYSAQLNPPRWEAGHIAWFQDYWTGRNRQRQKVIACDPQHERPEGCLPGADNWYDSSHVVHSSRWTLPLPDLSATRDYMETVLQHTLSALELDANQGGDLYFYRLVLFHEDMHAEASVYMAQALGLHLPYELQPQKPAAGIFKQLSFPATRHIQGWNDTDGFAFDNELPVHEVELDAFDIDSQPLTWRRFLPAVEVGAVTLPRYLRREGRRWQACRFGLWKDLDMDDTAVHINWHQAQAWCRWAKRRLPTETEWEFAALNHPDFEWGHAWEWTADRFTAFDGFQPHPYRDYSRFGLESPCQVLKGACRATDARMAHPRYRNFFAPDRDDIFAGFRTCAL